jgi:hypothetical protein
MKFIKKKLPVILITAITICIGVLLYQNANLKRQSQPPEKHNEARAELPAEEISKIKATDNTIEQIELYRQLIDRIGVVAAQEELYKSGLPFTGQTHLLNHTVGDYIYDKYGAGGLSYCKEYFLASCAHGFIIEAIAAGGMLEVVSVMKECKTKGSGSQIQCGHAVGHGFLASSGYANLTQALKQCDEIGVRTRDFPVYNCYDGVFMENIFAVHEGSLSKDRWVKNSDPYYPCTDKRIGQQYLGACWANQPSLMYQLFGKDIRKVGEYCDRLKNPEYEKTCFNGLARQIHPLTNNELGITIQMCGYMPKDWVDFCKTTVMVTAFSVGDRVLPYEICSRLSNPQEADSCYSQLKGIIGAYSKNHEDLLILCDKIKDTGYRETCKTN